MRTIGKQWRLGEAWPDTNIVVVVDTDRKEFQWFEAFATSGSAGAYQEGITDAWDHSRGSFCSYAAFCLSHPTEREEWESMGSPGRELFGHVLQAL